MIRVQNFVYNFIKQNWTLETMSKRVIIPFSPQRLANVQIDFFYWELMQPELGFLFRMWENGNEIIDSFIGFPRSSAIDCQ